MTFEWGRTPEQIDQAIADYPGSAGAAGLEIATGSYNHVSVPDTLPRPRQESQAISQPVGETALTGSMDAVAVSAPVN